MPLLPHCWLEDTGWMVIPSVPSHSGRTLCFFILPLTSLVLRPLDNGSSTTTLFLLLLTQASQSRSHQRSAKLCVVECDCMDQRRRSGKEGGDGRGSRGSSWWMVRHRVLLSIYSVPSVVLSRPKTRAHTHSVLRKGYPDPHFTDVKGSRKFTWLVSGGIRNPK